MRARTTWLGFAVATAVLLGVMAFITRELLRLEEASAASEAQAELEERVRLALWRLDTAMTSVVSRESAARVEGRLDDASLPMGVLARFELDDERRATALHARSPAEATRLEALLRDGQLLAGLDGDQLDPADVLEQRAQAVSDSLDKDVAEGEQQQVQLRNAIEVSQRYASVKENVAPQAAMPPQAWDADRGQESGPMTPRWLGEQLVLTREQSRSGATLVQGAWLDWPMLEGMLLERIADLLPEARLAPVLDASTVEVDRTLVSLPVRLLPGTTTPAPPSWSPLRASLSVGWLFVLLASGAVALLLRWSMQLSERRAAFVSAVTHELRTPLTTFRMYVEMLQEGMVEASKRARYLATLRREADRLGTLVENVLAYARIDARRAEDRRERVGVPALLATADRLPERCTAGGVRLDLAIDPNLNDVEVEVDPSAVEQILFNLVDNATKYGTTSGEARVEVGARRVGDRVHLWVRDHGTGIAPADVKRIFDPFIKATEHAAGTQPGVGLGLALCRRLAEQQRGRLRYEPAAPGARFVLELPVARVSA